VPDAEKITGFRDVDSSLAELSAIVNDSDRLEQAKEVVRDQAVSFERLQSVLGATVIQLAVALDDEESANSLLQRTPPEKRQVLEDAISFVKTYLGDLERHPAIVHELKKQANQKSDKKTDGKNTIFGLGCEPFWSEKGGKFVPSARVSFIDRRGDLLLDSTLDADDIVFLMRTCAQMLRRLFEQSKPLSDAGLLSLSDTEQIPERLSETRSLLEEIVKLGKELGMAFDEERKKEKPSKPQSPQQ
jgi:hypothetical protein